MNPFRGEVELMIEGTAYKMRLPLGVMVELESELESDSLMELVQRFETGVFSAKDLVALLRAGLRGGGNEAVPLNVDGGPVAAAKAGARLLAVTFAIPE